MSSYSHSSKPRPSSNDSARAPRPQAQASEGVFCLTGVDVGDLNAKKPAKRRVARGKKKKAEEDNSWLDELQMMHSSLNLCVTGEEEEDKAAKSFFKEARQWEKEAADLCMDGEEVQSTPQLEQP
eukprot:TRINITY_DN9963_c0_g1_i1.p1 TRINITY_DN9963_c0_g1~~TRINITY_DN9963_c0_g1_i1.p1  ORF type:complete len:125 (+),score=49.36 TRINITY_DN9963_c0_g1_i1:89-463(+)